jgi:thiosulfate dehydrogenase
MFRFRSKKTWWIAASAIAIATCCGSSAASAATSQYAMHEAIQKGARLFASSALGTNGMSCMTCHRAGGRTEGRLPNGKQIPSLVGTAATFPHYNQRSGHVVTLDMQLEHCVQAGLGGKPLAYDSPKMVALLSYVTSLSQGKPIHLQGLGNPRAASIPTK